MYPKGSQYRLLGYTALCQFAHSTSNWIQAKSKCSNVRKADTASAKAPCECTKEHQPVGVVIVPAKATSPWALAWNHCKIRHQPCLKKLLQLSVSFDTIDVLFVLDRYIVCCLWILETKGFSLKMVKCFQCNSKKPHYDDCSCHVYIWDQGAFAILNSSLNSRQSSQVAWSDDGVNRSSLAHL